MSRISRHVLAIALARVRAMDLTQKEQLGDELFRAQPHVFASFLVQQKLGVSPAKMDFLLEIVLTCFQAMKESGLSWPSLQRMNRKDRQMRRRAATVKFSDDLRRDLRDRALQQFIDTHPERNLLTFVQRQSAMWLKRVEPEESDKFVVMAALNLVSCIASVPLAA